MKKILYKLSLGIALTIGLYACNENDLEPTLAQQKDLDSNLVSVSDLETYLNGIYSKMREVNYLGRDYLIYSEVRSDNAYANGKSNRFILEAAMNYVPTDANPADTWSRIYEVIARANLVINKYEGIGGYKPFEGDTEQINFFVGQAYILRAMGHFDLTRIFGQQYVSGQGDMNALAIPYVKHFKGDPDNLYPSRNTAQEVYTEIKKDLEKASELMNEKLNPSVSYKISSYVAPALLSRVAIYFKDYPTAKVAAVSVINSKKYSIAEKDNFVATWKGQTSANWIFSLYSNSSNETLSSNALAYIYRLTSDGGGYGDVVGLGNLYDSYDAGDVRISADMVSAKSGSDAGEFRNLGKYPDTATGSDAIPIIRYEEIILNYAEALLESDPAEALTQLNSIPQKRGANNYTTASLENILLERRKELAFEGFRMFDLVRTGKKLPLFDSTRQRIATEVEANSHRYVFPIPSTEIESNTNMKQNFGYSK